MIRFSSLCGTMGKAHRQGHFQNVGLGVGYRLGLGPLFLECPHLGALPYIECTRETMAS